MEKIIITQAEAKQVLTDWLIQEQSAGLEYPAEYKGKLFNGIGEPQLKAMNWILDRFQIKADYELVSGVCSHWQTSVDIAMNSAIIKNINLYGIETFDVAHLVVYHLYWLNKRGSMPNQNPDNSNLTHLCCFMRD